ncbi:MAG: hypothetical protein IVW57_18305, partial [Ktedonobacterales bacterium]|nr:hypothetical protein [Ktedonobacterales bacterium]
MPDTTAPRRGHTPAAPPHRARPLRAVLPWVATFSTIIILGMLVLMLMDTGRISAGAQRPSTTPTPTPTPIPTLTATPLPTPMVGYKLYPDYREGFYIQYPAAWIATPHASGVDFTDNLKSGAFDAEVLIPSSWSAPDQNASTDEAAAWVEYVLTNYYGGGRIPGTFVRAAITLPPVTIGGIEWHTGDGVLTSGQVRYRVQVYAAIHEGKPYLINLAARDDQ